MKVAILNFQGVVNSSVMGPYDILSKIPGIVATMAPQLEVPHFEVDIVDTRSAHTNPLLTGNTQLNNEKIYDLVLIGAMQPDQIMPVLHREQEMIQWIRWQFEEGAQVASMCLGAFILASTGLLDGKKATTHWMGAEAFRAMFPKVELLDERIILDADRVYSSGGAFSFTSLMMYLLEKFCGSEVAAIATKVFLINVHQHAQQAYAIFSHQKSHHDEPILEIQNYLEEHFAEHSSLEALAKKANMSQRTFIRRFKKATGNNPYQYIQRLRIEAAKKALEKASEGVEQIALSVGYEDYGAFRKQFKKITSLTPSAYRRQYAMRSLQAAWV